MARTAQRRHDEARLRRRAQAHARLVFRYPSATPQEIEEWVARHLNTRRPCSCDMCKRYGVKERHKLALAHRAVPLD